MQCDKPDPRFAYIAPTYAQAKDAAWTYCKHYAHGLSAAAHETELRVDLPNGARIRLYGADNPDRLRGIYLDGVVLDEFADMRPSVWGEVVRPMLSDRLGWASFIGTPKGHNEFYNLLQRAQESDEWFWSILKASETGLLSAKELQAARSDMSEDRYAQEYECSFEAAIQGAIFASEMKKMRADNRICQLPLDPSEPVHTCWDIGKTDATSIWFFQAHGRMVHFVDYYENHHESVAFYAQVLEDKRVERKWRYGRHYGPHDLDHTNWVLPGREKVKDVAFKLGIEFIVVPRVTNKQDAIEAGKNFLSMCWIDAKHCRQGIEVLDNYKSGWDEDRKTWKKAEHDWASHGADAMMTGACGFTPDYIPPPSDRYAKPYNTRRSAWAA
jgi:phage terminase large subunit